MTENQPLPQALPPVFIRPAREKDIPVLVDLFRAHMEYHAALDSRYEPTTKGRLKKFFQERLRDQDALLLLAENALGPQAFLLAQMRGMSRFISWWERLWWYFLPSSSLFPPSPVGYIADCFVAEGARRQGIGQQLVEQALAWCRKRGAREVELGVLPENQGGRAFWEALGFKPCRIEMRREL